MKKIQILLLIPIIGVIGFSFLDEETQLTKYHADDLDKINTLAYSANPPTQKTGAPGESDCTGCHSGTAQPAAGNVTYNFSGTNQEYTPGQSYTIELSGSGVKNGFQMTILDGSNNAAGTFTSGNQSSTASAAGRNYIHQSASSGITDWSFTWNAPATDMGDLTVYYSYNRSNNNGGSGSDVIYLGQETISSSSTAGFTYHEKLNQAFEAIPNLANQQINISYQIFEHASIQLFISDINGKLIMQEKIGNQNPGTYEEIIDFSRIPETGIYLVSIFVNNEVLTKKVML